MNLRRGDRIIFVSKTHVLYRKWSSRNLVDLSVDTTKWVAVFTFAEQNRFVNGKATALDCLAVDLQRL